jgi:hypothetical protein
MRVGDTAVIVDGGGRRRLNIAVRCRHCAKVFWKPKRFVEKRGGLHGRHYCTARCASDSDKSQIVVYCANCSAQFSVRTSKANSGKILFCTRKCKDEAQRIEIGILKYDHYGNGNRVYRDRALRLKPNHCLICKLWVIALLDAHHVDGNRENGDDDNLILLCVLCHAAVTRKLISIDKDGIIRELVPGILKVLTRACSSVGTSVSSARRRSRVQIAPGPL